MRGEPQATDNTQERNNKVLSLNIHVANTERLMPYYKLRTTNILLAYTMTFPTPATLKPHISRFLEAKGLILVIAIEVGVVYHQTRK